MGTSETPPEYSLDPRSVSPQTFLSEGTRFGFTKSNLRPLLGAVIGRGVTDPLLWAKEGLITKRLGEQLEPLPHLHLENILTSPIDGFQKIIFRTADNLPVETVVIPLLKENKVTICLSSQVGCVMGCTFCATARMPQRRNLKSWEIIDQMFQARKLVLSSNRQITGAVFMGMGEPFLNYDQVMRAAEHFCFPVLHAISSKAITVSTVGLVDKIDQFTSERRPFRLSISLGSAIDRKRQKLVPVAARTPVAEVMAAARRHAHARRDRVMLAYVCISGENISEEDAKALGELVADTPVRLDLIDVNDTSGRYRAPSESEIKDFRNYLNVYLKQPVVRRYSGGSDIRASCGTLSGGASL